MLEVPYNKSELRSAVMSLNNFTDEEIESINVKMDQRFGSMQDKKEFNKRLADSNGITVLDLINSTNYEVLKEEFVKSLSIEFIAWLEKEGLTNVQAWSIIVSATGINLGL